MVRSRFVLVMPAMVSGTLLPLTFSVTAPNAEAYVVGSRCTRPLAMLLGKYAAWDFTRLPPENMLPISTVLLICSWKPDGYVMLCVKMPYADVAELVLLPEMYELRIVSDGP